MESDSGSKASFGAPAPCRPWGLSETRAFLSPSGGQRGLLGRLLRGPRGGSDGSVPSEGPSAEEAPVRPSPCPSWDLEQALALWGQGRVAKVRSALACACRLAALLAFPPCLSLGLGRRWKGSSGSLRGCLCGGDCLASRDPSLVSVGPAVG